MSIIKHAIDLANQAGERGVFAGRETPIATIDPAEAQRDPRAAQAAITRAQWEYARKTFLPIEDSLIDAATGSVEPGAQRAGAMSRRTFINARSTFGRDVSRRGISLTAAQSDALNRRRAINESKGIATSENLTRRTLDDRNRNLQGQLAGLGKGIATGAASSFNTAADSQASREATGDALNRQKKAAQMGGAASGAAMGFMVGGGIGAGIGAVAGWLFG